MAEAYQKKELLALINTGANKCTSHQLASEGDEHMPVWHLWDPHGNGNGE